MATHPILAQTKTESECLEKWCAVLRSQGYKITPTRHQLVKLILTSSTPVTVKELGVQARAKKLKLGLATIYRTIETLEKLALIRRVHDDKGCQSYMPADNQIVTAICQVCGQVDLLQDEQLQELLAVLPTKSGYQVNQISVQVLGLCAKCH